jgi:hypothetical protein
MIEDDGPERVLRAFVTEVSVLSPSVEPAEPGAHVVVYRGPNSPRRGLGSNQKAR